MTPSNHEGSALTCVPVENLNGNFVPLWLNDDRTWVICLALELSPIALVEKNGQGVEDAFLYGGNRIQDA